MTAFANLALHLNAPLNLEASGIIYPTQPGQISLPIGTGADYAAVTMEYTADNTAIDFTDLIATIGGSGGVQKIAQFQSIHGAVLQIIRTAETVSGSVAIASTPLKWASHTISPGGSADLLAVNPIGRSLHTLVYAGTAAPVSTGTHLSLDFTNPVGFKAVLHLFGQYAD